MKNIDCFLIFVGIHNKPGKMPLCSSTKSGKLIDRIIKSIDEDFACGCIKSNLYDVDYCPKEAKLKKELATDWWNRINPNNNDIIILLGAEVHKWFEYRNIGKVIKIAHPSFKWGEDSMSNYVSETAISVKELLRDRILKNLLKQI